MLLFKPAPIYILDEVDAALDLSHTQNIGQMLRTHFRRSQVRFDVARSSLLVTPLSYCFKSASIHLNLTYMSANTLLADDGIMKHTHKPEFMQEPHV